ncbi:E3 ubiquitin-protein ligase TRIM56-like, partial [Mizuhopecten yessoensis]|uniref:E3 ubiquitin-protein ligase TRIM56-like n=1 Tax=Mizuhopecten yessoensis TaxID=6573 RepID=UPI000B4592EB
MAEGGPLPGDHVNKDNTALLADQLLECPICMEQMRKAKSLPCLHSFCEECLSTYIVTDLSGEMAAMTSIPCPVCRKITSPVNHSEGKEMWAQHFPANNLIQHLTKQKEMAGTPLYCGPCKKTKNKETPAKFLCRGYEKLFCEHCKINFHDIVHDVCDIVNLNEANHDVTRGKQSAITCSKHNLMMDYHCENHKQIGCKKCIITEHRQCDEVTTIKEYCETKKNNLRLDDMERSLTKAANCIELMVNAFDQQVESLQRCQDVGLSSISDHRQRINTYLDKKQEEITQEMISKCKAEKAKVDLSKQKCSRLRVAIQNTKEASQTALRMEDHLGMIQLFHRGQTEIGACNDLIDDIFYPLKSVSINHDLNTNLFTTNPSTTLPLGSILAKEQPFSIPD